jgi:hypothetical protein
MSKLIVPIIALILLNLAFAQNTKVKFVNDTELINTVLKSLESKDIKMLDSILITGEILKKNVKMLQDEPVAVLDQNIKNNFELHKAFKNTLTEIDSNNIDISKIEVIDYEIIPQESASPDIRPPHNMKVNFEYNDKTGDFYLKVLDEDNKLYFIQLIYGNKFFNIEN